MGPAAFSANLSKVFRPLILSRKIITYLDKAFIQSQTKQKMFKVLDTYHQILQMENMEVAPDKSLF